MVACAKTESYVSLTKKMFTKQIFNLAFAVVFVLINICVPIDFWDSGRQAYLLSPRSHAEGDRL